MPNSYALKNTKVSLKIVEAAEKVMVSMSVHILRSIISLRSIIDPQGQGRIGGHNFYTWCPSDCPSQI